MRGPCAVRILHGVEASTVFFGGGDCRRPLGISRALQRCCKDSSGVQGVGGSGLQGFMRLG